MYKLRHTSVLVRSKVTSFEQKEAQAATFFENKGDKENKSQGCSAETDINCQNWANIS